MAKDSSQRKAKRSLPIKVAKNSGGDQNATTTTIGLPKGYTRATFIIQKDHVDKLKALSFATRTPLKDLVNQAMIEFLKDQDIATLVMESLKSLC